MGCITSKGTSMDNEQPTSSSSASASLITNHVVSLVSTSYGVLNLDPCENRTRSKSTNEAQHRLSSTPLIGKKEDLGLGYALHRRADKSTQTDTPSKKGAIARAGPSSSTTTMRRHRWLPGKENSHNMAGGTATIVDQNRVLKPFISAENTPSPAGIRRNSSASASASSVTPLFDPELIAFFERELAEEVDHVKTMVSPIAAPTSTSEPLLESFAPRCPPGGENAVVLYTTTLRGIRKTFEECNAVRAAVEAHGVEVVERDVSMDSGFREELRALTGGEAKVPAVFLKGRMVGGLEEVVRLEEEGKMGLLLEGVERSRGVGSCEGCGGVRFVVCMECHGSCRLVDGDGVVVNCKECNENGLIYCPICC